MTESDLSPSPLTDAAAVPAMPPMRLAGLEPVAIGESSLFVNIGERTNVTGSKAFARMILEGRYEDALSVARQDRKSTRLNSSHLRLSRMPSSA